MDLSSVSSVAGDVIGAVIGDGGSSDGSDSNTSAVDKVLGQLLAELLGSDSSGGADGSGGTDGSGNAGGSGSSDIGQLLAELIADAQGGGSSDGTGGAGDTGGVGGAGGGTPQLVPSNVTVPAGAGPALSQLEQASPSVAQEYYSCFQPNGGGGNKAAEVLKDAVSSGAISSQVAGAVAGSCQQMATDNGFGTLNGQANANLASASGISLPFGGVFGL